MFVVVLLFITFFYLSFVKSLSLSDGFLHSNFFLLHADIFRFPVQASKDIDLIIFLTFMFTISFNVSNSFYIFYKHRMNYFSLSLLQDYQNLLRIFALVEREATIEIKCCRVWLFLTKNWLFSCRHFSGCSCFLLSINVI